MADVPGSTKSEFKGPLVSTDVQVVLGTFLAECFSHLFFGFHEVAGVNDVDFELQGSQDRGASWDSLYTSTVGPAAPFDAKSLFTVLGNENTRYTHFRVLINSTIAGTPGSGKAVIMAYNESTG